MVRAREHEVTSRKVPFETGAARYEVIARSHILGDDSGLLKMLFHREHPRDQRNRVDPYRASRAGVRRGPGLFLDDGLQLSGFCRVLQGCCA